MSAKDEYRRLLERTHKELALGACRPAIVSLLRATRVFARGIVLDEIPRDDEEAMKRESQAVFPQLKACFRSTSTMYAIKKEEEESIGERRFKLLETEERRELPDIPEEVAERAALILDGARKARSRRRRGRR